MATEPLHEFHMNGKQLVFTFMSATVVAVVVFLCGVMVGRGVRPSRVGELVEATAEASAPDPTALAGVSPLSVPTTGADGVPASKENLSYPSRLEGQQPVEETLKAPGAEANAGNGVAGGVVLPPSPTSEPVPSASAAAPSAAKPAARSSAKLAAKPAAAPAPAAVSKPVAASPVTAPPATAPVTATPTATGLQSGGFVVQVAATKQRSEAETIARRLTAKGFPAFVTSSAGGTQMYRVRVGTFTDRRQAESMATRLEKEEQFKPWVTR